MYSGTTISNSSGALLGTHQKINRIAYKRLVESMPTNHFPDLKDIQYFEGKNGPDGIKRKSPNKDEIQHFCDPKNIQENDICVQVQAHYDKLVEHLRARNSEKAAFEASWLAHAVVDGLTPAHHIPYYEQVAELRGDSNYDNLGQKLIFRGKTINEAFTKNWQFWGAKGLVVTHGLFEFGVGMIALFKRKEAPLTKEQLQELKQSTATDHYAKSLQSVAELDMYQSFYEKGWSMELLRQANDVLIPEIIHAVSVMWAQALHESGLAGRVYA